MLNVTTFLYFELMSFSNEIELSPNHWLHQFLFIELYLVKHWVKPSCTSLITFFCCQTCYAKIAYFFQSIFGSTYCYEGHMGTFSYTWQDRAQWMMEPLAFDELYLVEKWYQYKVKKSGLIFNVYNALRCYACES